MTQKGHACSRTGGEGGRRPVVLLLGGYAGAGKTTFGRMLARQTGWPMLDKDSTTRAVVEEALRAYGLSPNDRESTVYVERIHPREHEALLNGASENVECGTDVIVTSPFAREFRDREWLRQTRAHFEALGALVTLAWVHCDMTTMRTYLQRRGASRDATKLATWDEYVASVDIGWSPTDVVDVVIDNSMTGEPLEAQATRLIASLAH